MLINFKLSCRVFKLLKFDSINNFQSPQIGFVLRSRGFSHLLKSYFHIVRDQRSGNNFDKKIKSFSSFLSNLRFSIAKTSNILSISSIFIISLCQRKEKVKFQIERVMKKSNEPLSNNSCCMCNQLPPTFKSFPTSV